LNYKNNTDGGSGGANGNERRRDILTESDNIENKSIVIRKVMITTNKKTKSAIAAASFP